MLDFLIQLDTSLFHFFNSTIANPVFDAVMPIITDVRYFYLPYILLFVLLIWKGGSPGRWCAAALALTILISDPLSSRVIKEAVLRLRPCATLPDVRLLVGCGAGKSFPSSHAVNNFAAAVVIVAYFRRYWMIAFAVAIVVSFSRVYVGVHYPGDLLGGAVIGSSVAIVVVWGAEMLRQRLRDRVIGSEKNRSEKNKRVLDSNVKDSS